MLSPMDERPAKRARQACEPCRRKKSRCPGERPVCSYCERLSQECIYSGPEPGDEEVGFARQMGDRMSRIEDKLEDLMDCIGRQRSIQPPISSPPPGEDPPHRAMLRAAASLPVPSRPEGKEYPGTDLFWKYCNAQPLMLFNYRNSGLSLRARSPQIMFATQALGLRFCDGGLADDYTQSKIKKGTEMAAGMVMTGLAEGVELTTIQTLCLLSMLEFTAGNLVRTGHHLQLASYFLQNLRFGRLESLTHLEMELDERKLCLAAVTMLRNIQCCPQPSPGQGTAHSGESGWAPSLPSQSILQTGTTDSRVDRGIIVATLQLSEVWALASNYAAAHVGAGAPPPWSPYSDYANVTYRHTDFDSRIPLKYRLHASPFQEKSPEELQQDRSYWAPWLFMQIVFHAIPCLLNHPFLLSMRLENFRRTMPQPFMRNSFEQLTLHSGWILHFLDLIEIKSFQVSDPFLGHCVAIVATICLQHSFVDDATFNEKARAGFTKCLRFLRTMGLQWPHIDRQARQLQQLHDSISSGGLKSEASPTPGSNSREKWTVNLQLLWKILVYPNASRAPNPANDMFGPELAKDSTEYPKTSPENRIDDYKFTLIGAMGISGHRAVAPELVTFAPDHVGGPHSLPETTQQPPVEGALVDINVEEADGSSLFLQMQDYGRAFEDWLSVNPP